MKVGVLTFHEVFNPGAYLQAMGTVSLLRSMGHEPVVINYTPPACRFSLVRALSKNRRLWIQPWTLVELYGRDRAFQKAHQYFSRTPRLLTHTDLENEEFDAVVIGSDIVWDYVNPHFGRDAVYFGGHINADLKISFAASCGPVPVSTQPPDYVVAGLKKFTAISVRDANTQQMVKRYADRDAEIICDPAFHLDIANHATAPQGKQAYLLVYMLPAFMNDDTINQTREYARKKGLKTIAVCYRQKWVDENRICIGPQEWLGYVLNASAIVTNTFHGTIFSIKAGVPFVSELNDAIRLKTITMIERLGIRERFLTAENSVEEILETPWDVALVHSRIASWTSDAVSFLRTALDG